MGICSASDVFSSNKRANPAASTIDKLQAEIGRLEATLNSLEAMLEDGKLNEDAADEIYKFREELAWERHLVFSYLQGFEKKEALQSLFSSLVEKTTADFRLTEKLRNEVRVKEGILKDMNQIVEKLSHELFGSAASKKREVDAKPLCHDPRSSRISKLEGSPNRDEYLQEAKKINYIILNARLSQAEVRKETLHSQLLSQQADLNYKTTQLTHMRTTENPSTQRTRQLEAQISQLRESMLRLETDIQDEQS